MSSSVFINLFTRTLNYGRKLCCANSGLCSSSVSVKWNVPRFNHGFRFYSVNSRTSFQCKVFILRPINCLESSFIKRNFSVKESFESFTLKHTSVFKSISESTIVEYTQNFIVQIHDTSGLPWWASIILTTCLVRAIIVFPLAIYQNFVVARYQNIKVEMDNIVNDIKYDLNREVRKNNWSEKKAKAHFRLAVNKEYKRLIERDNCHPVKTVILALTQIPLWVIFSTAFRNLVYMLPYGDTMAQMRYLEMAVGGVAWFPNLTLPDDFILPIMLCLTNLAIIELQVLLYKGERSKIQRYATIFFRGFTIIMIPIATFVPSCLTLYWVTSSLCGLCQNLILVSPRLRKAVGIPLTKTFNPHPYSHLAEQITNKFRK